MFRMSRQRLPGENMKVMIRHDGCIVRFDIYQPRGIVEVAVVPRSPPPPTRLSHIARQALVITNNRVLPRFARVVGCLPSYGAADISSICCPIRLGHTLAIKTSAFTPRSLLLAAV